MKRTPVTPSLSLPELDTRAAADKQRRLVQQLTRAFHVRRQVGDVEGAALASASHAEAVAA